MKDNVRFVFNGWVNLTASEKRELAEAINEYEDMSPEKKRIKELQESVKGIDLGPLSTITCSCCGR